MANLQERRLMLLGQFLPLLKVALLAVVGFDARYHSLIMPAMPQFIVQNLYLPRHVEVENRNRKLETIKI